MEKETKPGIRLSYDTLVSIALAKVKLMKRDIRIYESFGYRLKEIVKYEDQIQKFVSMPSDDDMKFGLKQETERKLRVTLQLRDAIRSWHLHLKFFHGNSSDDYDRVKIPFVSGLRDERLLNAVDMLIKHIRLRVVKYSGKVNYSDELEKLIQIRDEFHLVLKDHESATARRRRYTQVRKDLSAKIYTQLIKYCEVGRTYWRLQSDAEKASEYSINESILVVKNAEKKQTTKKESKTKQQ